MSTIRGLLFDWLFNATVQIAFFAILAAVLSRFIARARAQYQHWFYLAIFALCLASPVVNTFWQSRPSEASAASQQPSTHGTTYPAPDFWLWSGHAGAHPPAMLSPGAKTALVLIWLVLFLYQLIQFGRAIYRAYRLRKDASPISPTELGNAPTIVDRSHRIPILKSGSVDDPVTVGVFHPAIIIPSKVIPALTELDGAAVLAHELGHIQRKDFLVLLLCQFASVTVAWHPGVRYLMSKLSQTRELACDDYAAIRFGERLGYARALLRLASLCLQTPRGNSIAVGIFNGDNLETRIMMLTEKKTSLSRAGLLGLALTTILLFGSGTILARAVSLQEASASSNNAQRFAGTWHWIFQGRSFVTMILVQNSSGITGTVTPSRIALNDDGELSRADPAEDSTPAPITQTRLENNALHVTVGDGNQPVEFMVTLKDATHAEIHPIGAPSNMKPIQAERVN